MTQPVGIYISVPFCKAKCTFCNFASEAFPPERMDAYVACLVQEIDSVRAYTEREGMELAGVADSVFFGGGTPSLLSPEQFRRIVAAVRSQFEIDGAAEITVEAAPGQISDDLLVTFRDEGVNRISLGVQSFVDAESRSVGRLHTGEQCLREIERLATAGVRNRNVDLIAGLPYQNALSLMQSLQAAIASGVEHVSVYMLELDEESKLGREVSSLRAMSQLEVLGQHARYSAEAVPSDDLTAELYAEASRSLEDAGVQQYEISNFARPGLQSRHNRKYWTRAPYVGFGHDAHSMLRLQAPGAVARFAQSDDLMTYLDGGVPPVVQRVEGLAAFEEEVFLGLRLTEGLSVPALRGSFDVSLIDDLLARSTELQRDGLMLVETDRLRLTERGRIVSSSVFGELLAVPA